MVRRHCREIAQVTKRCKGTPWNVAHHPMADRGGAPRCSALRKRKVNVAVRIHHDQCIAGVWVGSSEVYDRWCIDAISNVTLKKEITTFDPLVIVRHRRVFHFK